MMSLFRNSKLMISERIFGHKFAGVLVERKWEMTRYSLSVFKKYRYCKKMNYFEESNFLMFTASATTAQENCI